MRLMLLAAVASLAMTASAHANAPPLDRHAIIQTDAQSVSHPVSMSKVLALNSVAAIDHQSPDAIATPPLAMRETGIVPGEAVLSSTGIASTMLLTDYEIFLGEEPVDLAQKARRPFFKVD